MQLLTRPRSKPIYAAVAKQPAWAVFVAFVCLAAQFGGALHLMLVPHSTCAEHGEAVHAAAAPEMSAANAVLVSESALAQAADGDGESDDHCLVAGLRNRIALALDSASEAISPPLDFALIMPMAAQDAPAAIHLLLFAPKTSPPHRFLT